MIYQFDILLFSMTHLFFASYLFKQRKIRMSAKLFFFNYFAVDVSN